MTGRQQLAIGALIVGVAAAVAFSATHYLRHELFPIELGSKAPDFTAYTLDSVPRQKRLADYRGQVVMVNVWATWCLPCRVEMPSIEALHKDYGPKGLRILAVSIDDPGTDSAIRAFARQYGLTFEILHDPKAEITDKYDVSGYPETFIVGRDGVIRKKLMQATDWNSADARALIDRLLAERAE
jgi:cytochrome c biogenesis protein CcmG, thiol:disulfide interchange protein DsbE